MAELAGLQQENTPSAELLELQALAYLDADLPEMALPPLEARLRMGNSSPVLAQLYAACEEQFETLSQALIELKAAVAAEVDPLLKSAQLLNLARLVRLYSGMADAEPYLVGAFQLNPGDDATFSLLENWWVDEQQWARLAETYRLRTEFLADSDGGLDTYRRAGVRLTLDSAVPGLGVRILQEGIQQIYQNERGVPHLIVMLRVLVEQLVESGSSAAAVRLLAQALEYPRSDDEVMWIVTVGMALATEDPLLERTKATFVSMRQRLVAEHPGLDSLEERFSSIQGEAVDWESGEGLSVISKEVRARTSSDDPKVARRIELIADVSVVLRAKIETGASTLDAVTRDLSATGLFICCNERLQVDEAVRLAVLMPGEDGWSLVEHQLVGVVVRVQGKNGYGIRFTEVNEEYLAHLATLVESENQ